MPRSTVRTMMRCWATSDATGLSPESSAVAACTLGAAGAAGGAGPTSADTTMATAVGMAAGCCGATDIAYESVADIANSSLIIAGAPGLPGSPGKPGRSKPST